MWLHPPAYDPPPSLMDFVVYEQVAPQDAEEQLRSFRDPAPNATQIRPGNRVVIGMFFADGNAEDMYEITLFDPSGNLFRSTTNRFSGTGPRRRRWREFDLPVDQIGIWTAVIKLNGTTAAIHEFYHGDQDKPPLSIASVTASDHDGNVPANTLDEDLGTRWSAEGDGQWIQYDLGRVAIVHTVSMAFYKGDQRTAHFDIEVSENGTTWKQVYRGISSGETLAPEAFDFTFVFARYIRIVGHGNTDNDWNSITEVKIDGTFLSPAEPLPVVEVRTSSHDGNVPDNTLDGDFDTRWSAKGDGQWLQYDLGSLATVEAVPIAFYKGDLRQAFFDIETSTDGTNWTPVLTDATSSGTTLALQTFRFPAVTARYVRIVGHGNSLNGWNSYTEVEILGSRRIDEAKLPVSSVTASSHDGNGPENTIDGDLGTRWSARGDGQWLQFDLNASKRISKVGIAFYKGNERTATFDIEVSEDRIDWTPVAQQVTSSGTTLGLQEFDIDDVSARYVRIVGYGNSSNSWNSYTEVEIWGSD